MENRYHRAARDGRLELLKEAFTRDLNLPDDDGMTPTLWTAYHGNLEALTLCCRRGGDYNKSDYTGNSCLHLAAQNGHLSCLSFLVKLGANLYKLDNDYNTALTVAGNRGHDDCVKYLDEVISKEKLKNPKSVKSKEEKAKIEADKRIKKYAKLQEKQLRKMKNYYENAGRKIISQGSVQEKNIRKSSSSSTPSFSQSITPAVTKSMFLTQRRPDMNNFVVTDNNRKEAKTLSGLPSSQVSNVMFMQAEGMSGLDSIDDKPISGRRAPVQNLFPEADVDESVEDEEVLAERPRMFGTIAIRGNFTALSMYSALNQLDENDLSVEDSVIPSASKPVLEQNYESQSDNSSDDDEEEDDMDPLVGFLESLKLSEYIPLFQDEKMDMEALMLCTSEDLKELGVSLGPRKKIMDALKSKKEEADSELTSF